MGPTAAERERLQARSDLPDPDFTPLTARGKSSAIGTKYHVVDRTLIPAKGVALFVLSRLFPKLHHPLVSVSGKRSAIGAEGRTSNLHPCLGGGDFVTRGESVNLSSRREVPRVEPSCRWLRRAVGRRG